MGESKVDEGQRYGHGNEHRRPDDYGNRHLRVPARQEPLANINAADLASYNAYTGDHVSIVEMPFLHRRSKRGFGGAPFTRFVAYRMASVTRA